jgi:hypothetical protein
MNAKVGTYGGIEGRGRPEHAEPALLRQIRIGHAVAAVLARQVFHQRRAGREQPSTRLLPGLGLCLQLRRQGQREAHSIFLRGLELLRRLPARCQLPAQRPLCRTRNAERGTLSVPGCAGSAGECILLLLIITSSLMHGGLCPPRSRCFRAPRSAIPLRQRRRPSAIRTTLMALRISTSRMIPPTRPTSSMVPAPGARSKCEVGTRNAESRHNLQRHYQGRLPRSAFRVCESPGSPPPAGARSSPRLDGSGPPAVRRPPHRDAGVVVPKSEGGTRNAQHTPSSGPTRHAAGPRAWALCGRLECRRFLAGLRMPRAALRVPRSAGLR